MKLISWNVNGIRAIIKKDFSNFLIKEKADVFCLQEIKISEKSLKEINLSFPGHKAYWNSAIRPGYSGTAVLIKNKLNKFIGVSNGIGINKFDIEGRVQTVDLSDFYLLNIYFPNSNSELSRLDYKLEFNEKILKYVKRLEKKKPVVITGDFNVAHREIDLARPKANVNSPGFTKEERLFMDKFLKAGFIDTFREKNGEKIQYSWWSFRSAARARNVGWRIDYFCVSDKLKNTIKKATILDKELGSDHAPVVLEIN